MFVKNFNCEKQTKLIRFLCDENLPYNLVCKLVRDKDIKVNNKRVGKDILLIEGDKITVYLKEEQKVEIVFEDENVLVAFKPRSIETISEVSDDFLSMLKSQTNINLFAVHRLDRNTEGLIVFAKNENAKKSLDYAFKNRTLEKYYLALTYGTFILKEKTLEAYLKKDEKKSLVQISDKNLDGYEKIITKYKVLKEIDNLSLIQVELVTGKTHQIRAHLSHIGHFVIGDEKYGDSKINKQYKKHYQCLCAYKLIFHFASNDYLSYLNGKEISLSKDMIDFCQNL